MNEDKYELLKERVEKLERENKELQVLIEEQIYHFMVMFKREGHHGMHPIAENLKKGLLKNWGEIMIINSGFIFYDFLEDFDLAKGKFKSLFDALSNEDDYDMDIYDSEAKRNLVDWHNKIENLDKATTDQLFLYIFKREVEVLKESYGSTDKLMIQLKKELKESLKRIENDKKPISKEITKDSLVFPPIRPKKDTIFDNCIIFSLICSSVLKTQKENIKSMNISESYLSEIMWQVYKKFKKGRRNDKAQLKAIFQELINEL